MEILINQEKKALREQDMKISWQVDEKFQGLKLEIAKEKKVWEDSAE